MQILLSPRFKKSYKKLPNHIKDDFDKKIEIFIENYKNPSLKTHKLHGNLEECLAFELKNGFRVLFEFVESNTVNLIDAGNHDKYKIWSK